MKVAVSGLRGDGKPWPGLGEVVDVPAAEGKDLLHAEIAEPVAKDDDEDVEKAVAPDDAENRADAAPAKKTAKKAAAR
jgi:hypothetical protein